ncbi:MAG: SDR family NAD(P)-dependent oxidoreductase [Bacteroidia bacterium]|nr:SDR family NAD(P)-dependent oxidoreductase [Bacteroidia bacterium]
MDAKRSILITGASTGIGKVCALHLDSLGFKVFTGVRKEEDREKLRKEGSDMLEPLILDVTDEDTISNAINHISTETEYPFYGLVNNAGIGISGVMEATTVAEFRRLIEVNLIGLHAVTYACLSLLRSNKGRIINIGSSASYLAAPGGGAYAASKYAVRAYTDSLRTELTPFGMEVSLVAPGAIESDIWAKNAAYKKRLRETVSEELLEVYQPFIRFGEKILKEVKPLPTMKVAEAVKDALIAKKPKAVYLIGPDAKKAFIFSGYPKRAMTKIFLKKILKAE